MASLGKNLKEGIMEGALNVASTISNAASKFENDAKAYMSSVPKGVLNLTADYLENSDFISRTIGMNNSYEDIMFIVQSLGREPISLLGKDYMFIFDHVRRIYNQGTLSINNEYNIPKFTFYKEKPTVRFANPEDDPMNLKSKWIPNIKFEDTSRKNVLYSYAESDDDHTNNREIRTSYGIDNANIGVNFGGISSFSNVLHTKDILKKTNDNFNHGKYRTLVARFHTNSEDSKDKNNITQTALTEKYGMSHGRNLLKRDRTVENGYDNPYCRVWTYHHQYNQIGRQIRPFGTTSDDLEKKELSGEYYTVGFRVPENRRYGFLGGSKRLDDHGVLNYRNGLVNVAPTAKIKDYFEHKEKKEATIKKCMFSIENLAWKNSNTAMDEYDQMGLSPEQKGPLGGRIMWFPPYNLAFNEVVTVNWKSNQFIGRGENVYTYTNTERTGNLNFTLLIDHPSILDYWTGHKRNGMKNQGKTLIPGNGGGVDEVDNQENTLLRFFAGCEILSAKPHEYKQRTSRPKRTKDPKQDPNPKKTPSETVVTKPENKHKIHCILYYPNNYSGVNDSPLNTRGSLVNSVYYLMNGVGAQKYYYAGDKKSRDIPTTIKFGIYRVGTEANCGGYEVRDSGISFATSVLDLSKNVVDKTIVADSEDKSEYLTDSDGTKYTVKYRGDIGISYDLTKIIGKGAKQGKQNRYDKDWLLKKYYYRVDKEYESQNFDKNDDSSLSYIDTCSHGLNSKRGFEKVYGNNEICQRLKIGKGEEYKNDTLISFTDLFVAAEGEVAKGILNDLYTSGNTDFVTQVCKEKNKYKIKSAKIVGLASPQGYDIFNVPLAKNRAETFKTWLEQTKLLDGVKIKFEGKPYDKKDRPNIGGANTLESKLWRCACLTIEYDECTIEDAATAEDTSKVKKDDKKEQNTNTNDSSNNGTSGGNNKDDTNTDNTIITRLGERNSVDDFLLNTPEGRKILNEHGTKKLFFDSNGRHIVKSDLDIWTATYQDVFNVTGKDYFHPMSWDYDDSYLKTGVSVSEPKVVERYDNEGEFFELLEENDPFMHHLITDKIRYFDPAYHAISPEGFNARLTFLQQCTRQGPTVGAGEGSYNTAYNLSFGRPPVCVLRLGDFFYTKIIITSLNINYEETTWDLNPEGIGVMPMFANVSLGFTFLGGSDLAGPISRLQNAVSFNYYANTSVYDNRAEMVQYDENGSGKEIKFKPYAYPNMIWNDGPDKFEIDKLKGVGLNMTTNVSDMNIGNINGIGASSTKKIQKPISDRNPQVNYLDTYDDNV